MEKQQDVKVVKDVRVSTEKNKFRVKTSRSQSPQNSSRGSNKPQSPPRAQSPTSQANKNKNDSNVKKISLEKKLSQASRSSKKSQENRNQSPGGQRTSQLEAGGVRIIKTSKEQIENNSKNVILPDINQKNSRSRSKQQQQRSMVNSQKSEQEQMQKQQLGDNNNNDLNLKKEPSQQSNIDKKDKNKGDKKGQSAEKNNNQKSNKEQKKVQEQKANVKEQKSKKKKDLEDQKKQLSKQQRLQKMEEDDQKKKEIELKRQIEREKQLKLEIERLHNEAPQIQEWNKYYHERFQSMQKQVRQRDSWQFFMECSGRPKINSQIDLNAFLYHFQQNISLQIYKSNWDAFLDKIQITLEIALDIIGEELNCQGNYQPTIEAHWYNQYHKDLTQAVLTKFDDMIVQVVGKADEYYEMRKQELAKQDIEIQALLKSTSNEERQKIEIFSDFKPRENFRFGYWINPVGKAGYRVKPIDFQSIGIQSEVPRNYMSNRLIMTVNWVAYDYLAVNYQPFFVVGGILHIELFEYPQLPRIEQDWQIKYRKENYEDIKKLHYPNFEGQPTHSFQNITPVKIFFQIPNYIYINSDNVKVATFEKHSGWTTEMINDVKFIDQEKTILSFSANKVAPFAIVAQRVEDFPFKFWKVRCSDKHKARLDIYGRRLNLAFEIGGGYVSLLPDEKPDYQYPFQHLVGQKMMPGQLLNKLQISGVNLLPHENDSQFAVIDIKHQEVEKFVISQVVRATSLFCVKFNHWNEECGQDKIIVSIKENPEYEVEFFEEKESDWLTVMWHKNKCGILKLKDNDKEIDYTLRNDSVTHSSLDITLQQHDFVSENKISYMKDKGAIRFWNTLQQFLTITRLFSFTYQSK